jgi:2Fe-2S ferredoxin
MKSPVRFTVINNDNRIEIETYVGEYRNLMALLNDKVYLDSFGECGGMGRCATCLVNITGMSDFSSILDRNEPITLSRFDIHDKNIRLSCQLLITNDLESCTVKILENL